MLHGWHGHNGVSLGNPRLGFVCTGQTVNADPGLEGYYYEFDHPLAENERVRFARGECMPPVDSATLPRLDAASWPPERLHKTYRSYAMEYVRTFMPVLAEQLGSMMAMAEIARTARLIGLQYFEETYAQVGAGSFIDYLIPTAMETPKWETGHTVTPSPHHPLGAKGVGESATVGAPAAIANAVVDALWHLGVRHIDIPITSAKVWKLLREAGVKE